MEGLPYLFLLFIGLPLWLLLFAGFWVCFYVYFKQRKDWHLLLGVVLLMFWLLPAVVLGYTWLQNNRGWTDQQQAEDWLQLHFAASWNPEIQHFRRFHESEFDLELVAFKVPEAQVQAYRRHLGSQYKKHEARVNEVLKCGQKRLAGWWDDIYGQTFDQADLFGDQKEHASLMVAYQRKTQILVFCNWNVYWSK